MYCISHYHLSTKLLQINLRSGQTTKTMYNVLGRVDFVVKISCILLLKCSLPIQILMIEMMFCHNLQSVICYFIGKNIPNKNITAKNINVEKRRKAEKMIPLQKKTDGMWQVLLCRLQGLCC